MKLQKMLPEDLRKANDDPIGAGSELVLGRVTITDLSNSRVLERLMVYERRIELSLNKTTAKLKRRQLIRQLQKEDVCEAEPDLGVQQNKANLGLR
jgi:hypothetical protein